MRKIKVGLVQINNSFFKQNYFPYSVGLLQAFAQKYLENPSHFEFLLPIYKRIPIKDAVDHLIEVDIVGFSTYLWNFRVSLEIAKRLKEKKPDTLIVFGGPQVPNRAEMFLRENQFVNLACHGEGEQAFLAILNNYPSSNWSKVPSVSYLDGEMNLIKNPRSKRISDINSIPSPYIEGIFDPLMRENHNEEWIVLWETNRGCPFSCSFCNWGSAVKAKIYAYDIQKLAEEMDWFSEKQLEFIYTCDANFGILQRDIDIVKYVAENKKKYGYPKALSVQNTKNATKRIFEIQKIMEDAGLNKGVTLSLQSMNKDTLESVRRHNIKIETFQELQQKFTANNIKTYTDIILGLPSETYETFTDGVSLIMENGQHNRIQFNNLAVLTNSEMGNPEYQRKYGFVIQETKIINIHGSLSDVNEISETQQLVVGTNTMPKSDWVRARAFSFMVALLHFDKILQIPLNILHKTFSIGFKDLISIFTDGDLSSFPVFSEIRTFFVNKAVAIQNGDAEYCQSKKWLNIWWPADELMVIKLATEGKLDAFYNEARKLFQEFLLETGIDIPTKLLNESIFLNQKLFKKPFENTDLYIQTSHNIWQVYQATLQALPFRLEKKLCSYMIDRSGAVWPSWQAWCKEVIWYGNKKGAYLYTCRPTNNIAQIIDIPGAQNKKIKQII